MSEMDSHPARAAPQPALRLGLAGLIPFVLAACGIWWPDAAVVEASHTALMVYGAVILSFLGGVRWGVLLPAGQGGDWMPWLLSVIPSLWAWLAVLIGGPWGLVWLIAGFALQWRYDRHAVASGVLPAWFGRLRTVLSSGAIASLVVGAMALWA